MSLSGTLNAMVRASGTVASYLTYRAITDPRVARQFFKTVVETIVEFPKQPPLERRQPRLPQIALTQICPDVSKFEIPIRITPHGNHGLTTEEYLSMAGLVQYFQPSTVFEIGTNRGRTTRLIAERSAPEATVYTLDLPPDKMLEGGCFPESRPELIGEDFRNNPIQSKIIQLFGDSRTFDFSPFYERVDFVFIDGDHCYETVKQDTEHALEMIRPGGVIVWDDYHPIYGPGVMECLEELAQTRAIYRIAGTRFGYHRDGVTDR